MKGWLLVGLVLVVYLLVGPWTWVGVAALLAVPQVRAKWSRPTFSKRGVLITAAVAVVGAGTVYALPDGAVGVPTAGAFLSTPSYSGRQVAAKPIEYDDPVQHPWQADFSTFRPGPLGDAPKARSGWYGLEGCRRLQFESHERLVAVCVGPSGPVLRVIDPATLRSVAAKALPVPVETKDEARNEACGGTNAYLDNGDRVVVATADRRVLAIATSDATGEPDLTVAQSWDLAKLVAENDCLVAVTPDWTGRIWWATHGGRVGVIDTVDGAAGVHDLGGRITRGFAVDDTGVYLATDHAMHRLDTDGESITVVWREEYDRGVEVKSGQLTQGTESGPTLVDSDLLAFTDNAEPRMQVVFLDRSTGSEVCRAGVFDGGESSSSTSLVSVGAGVVVVNDHGARATSSTFWGFTATGGLARVDHAEATCTVKWRNDDVSAPSVRPVVSWETGLLYTYSKLGTLAGVPAWYFTALDVETGKTMFQARAGTGRGLEPRRTSVTLSPDGEAFMGVVGGLVRVRDRVRD